MSILWGEADPWEDINLGRKFFAHLPPVVEFIPLPGAWWGRLGWAGLGWAGLHAL